MQFAVHRVKLQVVFYQFENYAYNQFAEDASKGSKINQRGKPNFSEVFCVTYRHHLALGGHEGRAVAQAELGLQGVEVDLQLALLLNAWRLVDASVIAEILQLLLHGAHGLLRCAVLQPRDGATDPLQQLQRDEGVRDREMD